MYQGFRWGRESVAGDVGGGGGACIGVSGGGREHVDLLVGTFPPVVGP